MFPKIALLSAQMHIDYLKKLNYDHIPCELSFIAYDRWEDLPEAYNSIKDDFDGFCTTGQYSNKILAESVEYDFKKVKAIMVDTMEYYKTFYKILAENRNADLSRIMFDFSLLINQMPMSVEEYVERELVVEKRRNELYRGYNLSQMLEAGELMVHQAKQLYDSGKMDLLIVRHSSLMPELEKLKIPYIFVYPEPHNVYDTLMSLINDIKIDKMSGALPAVIYLSSKDLMSSSVNEVTEINIDIQKLLLEFNKKNLTNFIIQRNGFGFEIFTNKNISQKITNEYIYCPIQRLIYESLGIHAFVGYGIGRDLIQARTYAEAALKQSQIKNQSCIINEDEQIFTLKEHLNTDRERNAEGDKALLYIAKKTGLSLSTIKRIRSVIENTGSNELTTQELASNLQVTIANANRFMNALEKSEVAKVISMKNHYGKGRPSKVFRISIE